MEANNFSNQVKEALQVEESLSKTGMNDIEVYNRCLNFCLAIYDKERNVLEDLENGTIDNFVVYQIIKSKRNLLDYSELSQEVLDKLESIYTEVKKKLTGE